MTVSRPPTAITDVGWYWLRAKDVTGRPRIARDTYFPEHGVLRPAETTADDLPATEWSAVRELDREALSETFLSGKWIVECDPEAVDEVWSGIVDDVSRELFWDAKVLTAFGRRELDEDTHGVAVYAPNYVDSEDVLRVRERLRTEHGISRELCYKPDHYTVKGINPETAAEWGLDGHARYRK